MSPSAAIPNGDNNDEYHSLVKPKMKKQEKSSDGGILQRIMLKIDNHTSCKLLMRIWGPRVEFVVRLMLVSTFLDDSLRTLLHFSAEVTQIGERGFVGHSFLVWIVLAAGLLAQIAGSLCVLALIQPNFATKALIGWAIVQPMLNGQLSNSEFCAESLTLIGGLLMLRAHLIADGTEAGTQMAGRMLLPAAYIYQAGLFLSSAFTLDETTDFGTYLASLSAFVVNAAVLVGLLVGSALVAAGLKSRCVAFFLALINLAYVCYDHPFFLYVWREGGEWKYDEHMLIPSAAMPAGFDIREFESWQIYDLHVYYFFLGLSTSGALLLLTQFGPGEMAMQKDEMILPVVGRAED